ncbi:GTPase domain-containing protein [Hymenobacter sp. GOD-10R]|uniref:GTPase domain-containing protein n=1 Tax=Hymenobacter sp. GOD-10R TaxID=3093922 RepID=UPI002D77CE87|nr:GTPase domain-containing protein [Hymenobacter sp. GOD-10R]WRQ32009.1 GTPase domain-containing protein [Hymenobacter sp. GOD-10R]
MIKTPFTLYQHRQLIQHWWIKFLANIKMGSTDIVIVGPPAVGKTVLSKCLHGQAPEFGFKLPGASTTVETEAIALGKWTQLVRVIPGQESTERTNGLWEAFHQSETLEGVIYVVDWGYSSPRNELLQGSLVRDEGLDTIDKLRNYNLKNELSDIKDIMGKIRDLQNQYRRPKWVLFIVNKADLFVDKINDAQMYYSLDFDSEFTRIVKEYINIIGTMNVKVDTLPMCSWPEPFVWNGNTIKSSLGGKPLENALAMRVISKIAELSS